LSARPDWENIQRVSLISPMLQRKCRCKLEITPA
jgi:hypothetical protein